MQLDALCIGHAALDLTLPLPGYPEENAKYEIAELIECGGGPAANAACLLARWGARTGFAGRIGDDAHGRGLREEFEAFGVDCSLLVSRPELATPVSVILVNTVTGSRTIINRKQRAPELRLGPEASQLRPRLLLVDGHELEASLQALEMFPDALSILDAGSPRPGTLRLASEVDYLIASERFAAHCTGAAKARQPQDWRAAVDALTARYRTAVVVTLGERGLVARDSMGLVEMAAFPAATLDTTGAGDVFHGAFAFAALAGMPFAEALRLASMAASLSVRKLGARAAIPELRHVQEELSHAH